MSLPLWLVCMPFHCQRSLLHNCPLQWLCLRFSLIVKVQLYRCDLLHLWEPCFPIPSSLQVPGGCEPPLFNSLHCRVCICLPSHPQSKALTKFLSLLCPMEKRWGRRVNAACPHWWQKVCWDFLALQGVSTCLSHSPQLLDFPKIWYKLTVCWSDEAKLWLRMRSD